ncbi:hypothetical protein HanIR_Chr14g0704281 [Helianthus annuus]|nr:hypothetical protein HanIR_Chr14g0704281 [Helianthus annuus]
MGSSSRYAGDDPFHYLSCLITKLWNSKFKLHASLPGVKFGGNVRIIFSLDVSQVQASWNGLGVMGGGAEWLLKYF